MDQQISTDTADQFEDCLGLMGSSDLCAKLAEKTRDYMQYISASGRLWTWRTVNTQMNNGLFFGGALGRTGIEGELVTFPVNIFADALDQAVGRLTETKIEWEPVAINSDFDSGEQTKLAKGILEFSQRHEGIDKKKFRQALDLYCFGEGHLFFDWDGAAGSIVTADPESRSVKMTGELRVRNVLPLQVIRDPYIIDWDDNQWFVVSLLENKYDVMKKFPAQADDIKELQAEQRMGSPASYLSPNTAKTDLITVNYFIHKRCQVLPFGRKMIFCGDDIVCSDGHLDTDEFPLDSMMMRDSRLTNFGYTPAFDALILQRMYDVITNAIASNITAFATINILVPDGADFSASDVTGGMNFIKFKPMPGGLGEPKALQLLATPPEAYRFLDWIEVKLYQLFGLKKQVTPNPDTGANGPESGTPAPELRSTISVEFNSAAQRTYNESVENTGNLVLSFLKKYASEERLGIIVGAVDQSYVKAFKKDDLDRIHRVNVNIGNPLQQTAEGRLQLALLYNSMGITDPHVIAEVIQTGQLQVLTSAPMQEMLSIQKEIEMLRRGEKPIPLLTQNHLLHIQQIQQNVLNDPEFIVAATTPGSEGTAKDAQIVQNALATIQAHINLWKQLSATNPELVAALKLPNIAPAGPAKKAAGAPGAAAPRTSNPVTNEMTHNAPSNGGTPNAGPNQ